MGMVIYKLKTGRYIDSYDMFRAYEIVTGEVASIDDPDYLKWLFKRIHTSVVSVFGPKDIDYSTFYKESRLMAVKAYSNLNNCTLMEADKNLRRMYGDGNGSIDG